MKKNLAKRVVLGLLAGAVLMSSSVAWAAEGFTLGPNGFNSGVDNNVNYKDGNTSVKIAIAIGRSSWATGENSIAIGLNPQGGITEADGKNNIAIGSDAKAFGDQDAIAIGAGSNVGTGGNRSIALGAAASVGGDSSVASVALGYGSVANERNVVSIGSGVANGEAPATRRIINVTAGTADTDAATVGQMKRITGLGYEFIEGSEDLHYINKTYDDTLTGFVVALDKAVYKLEQGKADASNVYSKTDVDNMFLAITDTANTYVTIQKDANDNNKTTTSIGDFVVKDTGSSSTVTINEGADQQVIFDEEGITVGKNSTRMDGKGFYVWADGQNNNTTSNHDPDKAIASINDKGEIKAANGAFKVDADGNVTGGKYNGVDIVELANSVASNDAVAGINQRLDKTNAKINKVGAGAAALAALHPLEYDPDDKLTFSAGMGNYAGENAAALGAFYRPNEKFMVSLGGTMGNGENMVNLGLSIGLDKASGFAKMSKRELIQEVNAVKAENEAMKAEMAEMKAMLQALLAKK